MKFWPWAAACAFTGICSLVLRAVILSALKAVFALDKFSQLNVSYRKVFGEIFDDFSVFAMMLKRFWVKYYLNAFVYLPITVLVVALLVIGAYALYYGIRKKDVMLPLCAAVVIILPIVMCIIEGIDTRYRTAQYIPLVCAFGVLLLLVEIYRHKTPKILSVISYLLFMVLLYNQCADMNKWFYVDYQKYSDAERTMEQIALDLKSNGYDISKPIIFRGAYRVPHEIAKEACVSFSSMGYKCISKISDLVDIHLKEKYWAQDGGYAFAETPLVSTLQWGVTAFDGTSQQLINFWQMHGHDEFRCETDLQKIEEAEQVRNKENMPAFPETGYILECEDYIIVNLGNE